MAEFSDVFTPTIYGNGDQYAFVPLLNGVGKHYYFKIAAGATAFGVR